MLIQTKLTHASSCVVQGQWHLVVNLEVSPLITSPSGEPTVASRLVNEWSFNSDNLGFQTSQNAKLLASTTKHFFRIRKKENFTDPKIPTYKSLC